MKRNITSRNPRPTTVPELRHAILEEWKSLTSKVIANYNESVPERIHNLLAARGADIQSGNHYFSPYES